MTAVTAPTAIIAQAGHPGTATLLVIAVVLVGCALCAAIVKIVRIRSRPEVIHAATFRRALEKADTAIDRENVLVLLLAGKTIDAKNHASVTPIIQERRAQSPSAGVVGSRDETAPIQGMRLDGITPMAASPEEGKPAA